VNDSYLASLQGAYNNWYGGTMAADYAAFTYGLGVGTAYQNRVLARNIYNPSAYLTSIYGPYGVGWS